VEKSPVSDKLDAVENNVMKLREMYSSHAAVGGLLCLVLGIGNWVVGAVESAKYQALLHKTCANWIGRILPELSGT
jgi:hypothetical protein